jgi:uncharacterized membrane protein
MDLRLLGFSGLFDSSTHPAFVHFPLALVPVALVLLAAGRLAARPGLRSAGRVCLWLAVVSLMASVFTGAKAAASLPDDPAVWALLKAHRGMAFLSTFATVALAAWASAKVDERPRVTWLLLAGLALDCLLLFQTGDLGARMVYGHGAAVKPGPPGGAKEP